ncbi:unnamed protein product [Adineta steineri]|uniref:Metallo-beta-lactamase domain-containing protein n=1 Tax=Adineta steineri TaxID=433720 RepID=A0A819KGN7_9BILA|nr:unnamed protein product [Adineta steineri]CAF3948785.1 unnamed protein product [Adineta steineri]
MGSGSSSSSLRTSIDPKPIVTDHGNVVKISIYGNGLIAKGVVFVDKKTSEVITKSNRIMRSTTTIDNSADNESIKASQRENGGFVHSFNPKFRIPNLLKAGRWLVTKDNTGLPTDIEELNRTLPIIKHKSEEILKRSPGLRFLWIGHASCLVQIDDFMFLTDPVFSERCGLSQQIGQKRYRPAALTIDDLPDELEAIVISHNHFDHLDYESVQSLNARYGNKLTWFCGIGGRQWFINCFIKNVVELDWWQEWVHPTKEHIIVAFCPAQHWSRRTLFDLNKSLWGGYAIWNNNYRFYFAGDTGYTHNIPIFKQIGKKYGPFDLSAIPIGAYEPRWMMEAQHVSPEEAVQIHIDTKSKKSIGIHWGTWALANEFYLEPKEMLQTAVEYNRLDPKSFIVVCHGEIFDLPENN